MMPIYVHCVDVSTVPANQKWLPNFKTMVKELCLGIIGSAFNLARYGANNLKQ